MYYVYVLRSIKDGQLYIGKTINLKVRLTLHNQGRVKSTRARKPFKLIYYESFTNRKDWNKEELFLKSGIGRQSLKHRLEYTLNTLSRIRLV